MAEITKPKASQPPVVPKYVWVLLALLAVFVYFFGLNLPLLGPDEPRYAQVAREMFDKGDWVTPTLGGFTWFEKPALLYWLEIASFRIFGVTEFAARLGPALFGLGTITSLWILGRSINKNSFANWLALISASTLGILVFSHGASFDIIITFPMTAALVGFFIFDQAKTRTFAAYSLPLISFYVLIGVSLLAKGLIGFIFPFAIVAFYHVLSWKLPSRAFVMSLFWGVAITIAVASIWYVPVYLLNGWPFIDEFIIQHHFQRFTSNKFQHPQPVYFFLWVLPLMTLPWLPLFFAAIWSFGKGIFQRRDAATQRQERSPLLIFSVAWLLVPLVFFSLSGSKLPGYILPSVPAAIILTSVYAYRLIEKSRFWAYTIISTAALVFLITSVLVMTVVPRFADSDSVRVLIRTANERGLGSERVFNLHTLPQGTEFYAPGRLLRDGEGMLKKLYSPAEVVTEMQRANVKAALVLVPANRQKELTENPLFRCEILKDNGELAIAQVTIE